MKKLLSLLIVCVCASAMSFAQEKNVVVSGLVQDKKTAEPVMQATVQLLTVKDSTFVAGNVSDEDGRFALPSVASGSYLLKISYTGYTTMWKSLSVNKSTDMGILALEQDAVLLKQATVTAQLAEVQVVEDTVMYNAGAYRVPPGSMLEELVKKLPGAQVDENGQITINGKKVSKFMMNGKEFFSGDQETAMKNVPVEMIDRLKVYDRQSDLARVTGIDDGNEETVIDMQVKPGMAKGWFGNTDLGYGTEDRYSARLMLNHFDDVAQTSILGGANNVGGRGFPGGAGGFMGGGGGGGLRSNKNAGFNFAMERDNIEFGGDIRYTHNDSDNKTITSSETFLQSGSSYSNSRSNSMSCSGNWNINFRLEWTPDLYTNIIFRPTITFSRSNSFSESNSATFNQDPYEYTSDPLRDAHNAEVWAENDPRVNLNDSKSNSDTDNLNASGTLQVNRRLSDEGRNLTFVGTYSYGDSESKSVSASNVDYISTGSKDIRNRYNVTPGKNWNYNLQFTYSEPIMEDTYLQFIYSFSESYTLNDRSTYDFSPVPLRNEFGQIVYDEFGQIVYANNEQYVDYMNDGFPMTPEDYKSYLDKEQSQYQERYNYNHEGQAMLRVNRDNYQFNAGFTVLPQTTKMDYKYLGKDTILKRTVVNFTPNIRFRYNWDKQTRVEMTYRGRSSQPNMTDMLDITDDTNPLNITQGNPGLKPSFNHNMSANFNTYNMDKQRSIFGNIGGSLTQNNVSSKVTYDPATGGRITRPENINGNWSANGSFGFNTALPNKHFTVSTNTNASYNNSVQYFSQIGVTPNGESVKNATRSINAGEQLRGTYRNDWENGWGLEVTLSGNLNYQHAENDMQPERNMDTYMYSYGGSTNVNFPWNMTLSTDMSMNSRRGYSDPNMNTDELIWNAQIAQALFNGAATLSLQFYDILHEQSNISRTINASMRRDSESNAINSYCMVHFIYRLNIFGDGRNAFRRNRGGMGEMPGGMMPGGMMPGMMGGGMPAGGGFGGGMGGFGGGMGGMRF
ncbi:MAG: TonB-dependent receptor [Bacteroidaceae bacterium]|nr:TonB-dependent receptor [Bacteroidaceae bacterium]